MVQHAKLFSCPISPTRDNVVLERFVYQPSKLYLGEEVASSVQKRWRVLAIGPECKHTEAGMFIIFNSPTAGEIKQKDEDGQEKTYVILPEKDIVGIYKA